jgi:hypothetical protein
MKSANLALFGLVLAFSAYQGALLYANDRWKTESYNPRRGPLSVLFYMNVILVPLRRLQTLILAMAGVFVFVLLFYSSYPFESRESFHALLIAIFFTPGSSGTTNVNAIRERKISRKVVLLSKPWIP